MLSTLGIQGWPLIRTSFQMKVVRGTKSKHCNKIPYTLNKGKQSILLSMEEKGPNFSHPTSLKEIRPKPGLKNKARYHPDIGRAFQANVAFAMTQ